MFSFAKENTPFGTPRERRFFIASKQLEEGRCLPMLLPARGAAAFEAAIRFASASTIRCRSAHLVEVHLIIVYRGTHQCGERSNAAFGTQSAAKQTSLAPHDSKARLRVVTTCRRFMAKPCTPHPITRKGYATSVRQQSCQRLCNAQRMQLFELLSCNGGVKGQSPLSSLGGPRGPFSHVREWPPYPRPPARCRETVIILHNHNPHLRAADPRACTDQDIY